MGFIHSAISLPRSPPAIMTSHRPQLPLTKKPVTRCCASQEPSQDPLLQKQNEDGVLPLELVDGYLDNAKVRPKIDIDADEYMLMWKLRKMLHEDDFNKIFDSHSRRIGEL